MFGVLPYIDPKVLHNRNENKLNKKSDVYSIGVLMWQISSGNQPFADCDSALLTFAIKDGKREEIINGTPTKYSNLYQGNNTNNFYFYFYFYFIFSFFLIKKN